MNVQQKVREVRRIVREECFTIASPLPGLTVLGERFANNTVFRPWWQSMPRDTLKLQLDQIFTARSIGFFKMPGDPTEIASDVGQSIDQMVNSLAGATSSN